MNKNPLSFLQNGLKKKIKDMCSNKSSNNKINIDKITQLDILYHYDNKSFSRYNLSINDIVLYSF
jgi:hypothetical protein